MDAKMETNGPEKATLTDEEDFFGFEADDEIFPGITDEEDASGLKLKRRRKSKLSSDTNLPTKWTKRMPCGTIHRRSRESEERKNVPFEDTSYEHEQVPSDDPIPLVAGSDGSI